MSKIKDLLFRAKFNLVNGADIKIVNDGNPVEEVIIQHKGFYISLLVDIESGEPVSYGWFTNPSMTHVPVREWYKTTRRYKK